MEQNPSAPTYHKLWAKTSSGGDPDVGTVSVSARYHPLAYHLLDVAAVARAVLNVHKNRLEKFSVKLDIEPDKLEALVLWLVALHDVGKASSGFQLMAEDLWCDASFGGRPRRPTRGVRHDAMTAWYLGSDRDASIRNEPVSHSLDTQLLWSEEGKKAVINAIAGHHGKPVQSWGCESSSQPISPMRIGKGLISCARALNADLMNLFGVQPIQSKGNEQDQIAFAWWLATLLPLCDWVGSNTLYFRPRDDWVPLPSYWNKATAIAKGALAELGLNPSPVSKPSAAVILPRNATQSPVQEWAEKVELPMEGPVLTIIEDATGSGKTEAALILAHRLMYMGHACGFHIALPTMATADAMYRRLKPLYPNLFEGGAASLSLAHAKAKFMQQPGEPSAAGYCSGWIARESRRAFFAQAGAGTIDQSILAILASKYQSLRLCGLADKILIIDEAHAFDAYMSEEISALLRFHAAQGGSAIILSATLPQKKRQALVDAFTSGLRWPNAEIVSSAYPLTTIVSEVGITETPGSTRKGTERAVKVKRLDNTETAEMTALETASSGAAVAIIRSTVDQAIETYNRLKLLATGDVNVQLFHARYLFGDRQAIEEDVVNRFGKASQPHQRARRILVATAVIEQSLDLDFDMLISDLAPVDLLVQRAGRLWRHKRDRSYSNVTEPIIYVTSPEPEEDDDKNWLDATMPHPVWIYKDPALLWRSAKAVFDAGSIETATLKNGQSDAAHPRCLVEAVYGELNETLSDELFEAFTDAEGREMSEKYIARTAVLDPSIAYGSEESAAWADDGWVKTRLGDSDTVRIVKLGNGKLVPFAQSPREDWSHSEVNLSSMRMRTRLREPDSVQRRQLSPQWHESDNAFLLVMDEDGIAQTDAPDECFRYCTELGLRLGNVE